MRVLFVTWNGGGNVHPAVALATRLQSRGHDVRVLGPKSLVERFAAEPIEYRAHRSRSEWAGGQPVVRSTGPTPEQRRAHLAGMAEDVRTELDRAPTDVVVVDYMQPDALCAAERTGVPVAAFVHTLHRRVALSEMSPMSMSAGVDEINALRRDLDLAPIERLTDLLDLAGRVLVVTASELDDGSTPLASNVRYVGPLVEAPGPDVGWMPPLPDDGRPLVVVSMGTTPMNEREPLQRILDALAGLPVRVFATVGHHFEISDLKAAHNTTVSRYIRHSAVLPHARLLVTHAGLSSVGAALEHGVPMLCVPLGRDQPINAERVRALGTGLSLPQRAGVLELTAALRTLLAGLHFGTAARRVAARLAADGHGQRAIEELDRLARSGSG